MATKKKASRRRKVEKPFIQFSKKMVTSVLIFWGVIRMLSVVAVILNTDAGNSMAAIVRGVDDIAMVIVLAYTGNSVSEKIALGYFQMRSKEEEKEKDEDNESNG